MHYIATTGWEDGVADLTERLINELAAGKHVLWLLSGGSNIQASVGIAGSISDELSRNVTVGLIDERFGPIGHADSNWQQLMQSGFQAKYAELIPVLAEALDLQATAAAYNQVLRTAIDAADVVIAQLGIGGDGHISGILPGSNAATELVKLVTGYEGADYSRITTTPAAFKKFSVAYVFAFGESKLKAVQTLQSAELTVAEQPAQLLKQLPEAYLYSDQIGDQK